MIPCSSRCAAVHSENPSAPVTTFALHGFNDDRRHFLGGVVVLNRRLLDPVERALARATITTVSRVERIAKLVRVRNVYNVEGLALETLRCAAFDDVTESEPSVRP